MYNVSVFIGKTKKQQCEISICLKRQSFHWEQSQIPNNLCCYIPNLNLETWQFWFLESQHLLQNIQQQGGI